MKRGRLNSDPEKVRAFIQRGRESSARSLQQSARKAARNAAAARRGSPPEYQLNWQRRLADHPTCEIGIPRICLTDSNLGPHHVFPQRLFDEFDFADHSYENLRVSCWPCNNGVEAIGVQTAARLGWYSPVPLDPTWKGHDDADENDLGPGASSP